MADPTGFLKHDRALPTRRPVDVRIRDWKEVYEDFAPEHLHGRSREVEEVLPSGTRQRCLEMTLDGEVHRVPEEQEAVFDSWQAALLGLPRVVVVHLVRRACRRSR